MRRLLFSAGLSVLFAVSLRGQTITAGSIPPAPNFGFDPGVATVIDLSFPATSAGTMSSATFIWQSAPCVATVKIKFFRPSGATLIFLAERGPFDVTALTQTVALSPGVAVLAGDLVGIARVVGNCGSPVGQTPGAAAGFVAYGADITFNVTTATGQVRPNASLAVSATGIASQPPAQAVAAIIPVAISSPGLAGSFFRTGLQAFNASTAVSTGSFVFRAQGSTAVGASLAYSLSPGQTQSFSDLLAAMGQSGVGTIDVVASGGTAAPVVSVRVYNDGGALGTVGFTEDALRLSEALVGGNRGALIAPFDLIAFRFNIGVRTLGSGASISFTLRDQTGNVRRTFAQSYPPNFFQQIDATSFFGIAPLPNDTLTIDVTAGGAFVYGVTADNRTNDPAIGQAQKVF